MRLENRATEKLEESNSRTAELQPDEVQIGEMKIGVQKWKRRPGPSFPFLRQAGHAASLPGTYYREELNSLETAPRAVDSVSPSGPTEAFAS